MPKPKNSKQNNSKNLNTLNAIIYTKGTIKKSNPNNNNVFMSSYISGQVIQVDGGMNM